MSQTAAVIDEVEISDDGQYTVTGKEVTVTTTKGPKGLKLKPGTYPVDIKGLLDRIVDKEPLYAHIAYKLNVIESVECPSSGTDGVNLYWNKDFLSCFPEDQQCGVILHEILHCAFLHLWRRKERTPEIWNIACDYAINLVVNRTFPLPPGTLLDTQYINLSSEEIYDLLPVKDLKQQGWCDKSDWGDGKKGQGQGKGKPAKGSGAGDGLVKKLVSGLADAAKKAKEDAARAKAKQKPEYQKEQEWDRGFDEAFTKNYSNAPEYLKRVVGKKHYIPVINWQELVSQILSEDIVDYTFSQPDRRFLEWDFMLPELYSWDRVKDVIFGYDTSGSISKDDLRAYRKETLSIMEQFPSLSGWAAICDADLHAFKEINPENAEREIEFLGGGGTDFRPVFDEVETRALRPKAMFYFTDTYGSFPADPGYPVFWLVHSRIGDNSEYHVPFGKVIKFMNKSDL